MTDLATRYGEWWRACERERLRAWLAEEPPDLVEIDARYDDVTSGDAVDELHRDADTATLADASEARRRWLHHVESAVLGARVRTIAADLRLHERPEVDELREELFARSGDARARLGYDDGRARARSIHPQVDFETWTRGADALLERSEPAWLDALHAASRRAELRTPTREDLPKLLASPGLDRLFTRRAALLDATFDGMGASLASCVSIGRGSGVEAGARCFAPDEVVLAVRGGDGLESTLRFFAAAGCAWAEHFRSESLPVERRFAIDPALAPAWALLFESVLHDSAGEGPAQLRAEELREQLRFRNLLSLRTTAARALFESALADLPGGSDPHAQAALFAECRERATALPHPTHGYLLGADAELGAVHELRARSLAGQLAERLRSRFGRSFWHERGAAELLKELWNTGGTYRAEELAADLDAGPLDVAALVDHAVP
jgi:hypothetical protein